MGFDKMGLTNNDNAVLAFNGGLLGEKYIKVCVCVMFLRVGLETTLIKKGEFII